jgi:predicted permease
MLNLRQDVRYAFRLLRRSPGFTAVCVLSLALGIGANTAIFSVMDGLMLRSLPVKNPEDLVLLGNGRGAGIFGGFPRSNPVLFSQAFYQQLRDRNQVFDSVAAISSLRADVFVRFGGPQSDLEQLRARVVSGGYFQMLGVGALAGRVLNDEDNLQRGNHPVLVISHSYWQRRFGADRSVVGRTLTLNGAPYTIVGIAARDFFGTTVGEATDAWAPLSMQKQIQGFDDNEGDGLSQSQWIMARRKPGVSNATAQANVNVNYNQWLASVAGASPSPDRLQIMKKIQVELTPAGQGLSRLRRQFSEPLRILMVVVGLVLLIACANIANLLLARAASRQREIAVRLALGVERSRLVAQLISESLLLALLGGAAGILVAWWGGPALLSMVSTESDPASMQVGPNPRVLLFTFALSLLTGLTFGILPALRMTKLDPGSWLKSGKGAARAEARSLLGRTLVVVQVALALFLTVGAGLFVRTLQSLQTMDAGFEQDRAVVLGLDASATRLEGAAAAALAERIESRVREVPGVQAAAFSMLRFDSGRWVSPLWIDGAPRSESRTKSYDGNRVGRQYFQVMGMPIIMGRGFQTQDTPQAPHVSVINETLAKQLFPGASPLGRYFETGGREGRRYQVVGVVRDARYESLREDPRGMWFVNSDQEQDGFNDLTVRVQGDPALIFPRIRAAIREVNSNIAIADTATLRELVTRSLGQEKLLARLAGFFGLLALLLSAIGLYGVTAYSVSQRTNEIGIRMALGAQPVSVLTGVLRQALVVVAIGLAIGFPAVLACGKFVSSQLHGLKPNDPLTLTAAVGVLLLVALAATLIPARRAACLDPLVALREE